MKEIEESEKRCQWAEDIAKMMQHELACDKRQWYEEMHRAGKVREENFWEYQKSQMHRILAAYILSENVDEMRKARQQIVDRMGSVDDIILEMQLDSLSKFITNQMIAFGRVNREISKLLDINENEEPPEKHGSFGRY